MKKISLALALCGSVSFAFQLSDVLKPIAQMSADNAEITAYMPEAKTLFAVGGGDKLDVIDLKNPMQPVVSAVQKLPGDASSVTVHGNLVAVSLLNDPEWKMGKVQVMRYNGSIEVLGTYEVCNLPDMITFTPDGKKLLVACEGTPSEDFSVDPEGAVAVLSANAEGWKKPRIKLAKFDALDTAALMAAGVRKAGVKSFAQSLEPEYITVSEDSKTAWISLQENNAIAKLDVASEKITGVFPLGYVDHSKPGFGLDVKSNKKIEIENYPLRGLRQPDGISAFTAGGKSFVLTANEGASVKDFKAWTDVTSPLVLAQENRLDSKVFNAKMLDDLQNLSVSNLERCDVAPDKQPNGKCPYMYTFGSRSVSLFDGVSGKLIWDSGDQLERVIAKVAPDYFNWNSKKKKVKMDSRSENMGCEPENVTYGVVNGKRYAFVGLERTSGIAVFDISDVEKGREPKLVDFYFDPNDRGPEGILFISAEKSPLKGTALLVVGYEYSKTISIYKVK